MSCELWVVIGRFTDTFYGLRYQLSTETFGAIWPPISAALLPTVVPVKARSVLLTLPILTFMLVSATFMQHYIEMFESLIGGSAMGFNALTFPAITYLQICEPKRLEQRISALAICGLGLVLPLLVVACP
jgi:hypothetical protein